MLIREGSERTLQVDLSLATVLAFLAGGVNSAGFVAYGYFSANMTGNVSTSAEMASVMMLTAAGAFLIIVVMFMLGAFLASLFIEAGKRLELKKIYAVALSIEAVLLIATGMAVALSANAAHGVLVVGTLSFAMGIQNAASTRLSGSRVRTTHVSGVATDLGIGLGQLLSSNDQKQRSISLSRLRLNLATLLSFALGGVAGVLSYQTFQSYAFSLFGLLLLFLSARYVFTPSRMEG
ncbi:YoaK family protein [Rhizobium halophytocola]|uniref:Uncharacterized membrane protein YoaK (UPF0700 family) n=1 Tax=Rhizobium halophytocola TaxID=735519 RepID=A0ABS4E4I3_9HYPH|nr:YoaK family protein [Rhizobium halophytocola]MBP1852858.1 uncharacterized membrane protein YoaK (UPF0700 family) [Rhizobium halophytocola]